MTPLQTDKIRNLSRWTLWKLHQQSTQCLLFSMLWEHFWNRNSMARFSCFTLQEIHPSSASVQTTVKQEKSITYFLILSPNDAISSRMLWTATMISWTMWILSIIPFFSDSYPPPKKKKSKTLCSVFANVFTDTWDKLKIPSTTYVSTNLSMSLKEGEKTFVIYNEYEGQ